MTTKALELATVGGGCFWCTEAVFQEVKGVEKVVSGYSGGNVPGYPTYHASKRCSKRDCCVQFLMKKNKIDVIEGFGKLKPG
ncbi:MAG: peptide-methionine (S)-S-oxide reductase, partial [Psychroserpens sp.]|nr:peptide-methionine (S)-S-oxide reductase [Psychroserpens sp.]